MENEFLTNYGEPTFLDKIKKSLENCNAFYFSVSFIKDAGLVLFSKVIEEALKRGVNGKIITSTYQNFTDIRSLETFKNWMEQFPNFECHLDYQCFGQDGFHSKGYLFEYGDSFEFIVGSSNITRYALLRNIEWNVSLKSKEKFKSLNQALEEFDNLWNKTLPLTYDLIKTYQLSLDYAIEKWDMDYEVPTSESFRPNAMQRTALKELRRYRDMGVKKALVISATGSGKTLLAAFDARNYEAKRLLFVVHRDKILSDARAAFSKVFGAEKTYGLFVGKNKDLGCDFVFASNIMLAQHLNEFDPYEFDYIVLDECHHAAASSYQKIMEYFKPGFMLGITATPERMDNQDVFELFDKNVPYELRLRDAIINDLVVPFHYYGIRDKLVDYSYSESALIAKEVARPDNVKFIIEEINKHKPTSKLKCLAFCSSIAHASLMAEEFNKNNVNAVALTGVNDLGQRIRAFNDLQDETNELEVICAVDILNEGVDIPGVNMVLFLRPTESSTIFLQQLGRGLRKYEGKQYVTVLDFIGNNYKRSVQIALALSSLGTSTVIEKPYIRELIKNDFKALSIPGVIVDIDELSKEEIIDYVDSVNFNKKEYLKKDYENYKAYLKCEKYPSHMEYLNNDCAPDLMRFMKANMDNKNYSYYSFLCKIGEDTIPLFTDDQVNFINEISDLLPLVRVDEYLIVN
ncbi:MAG: DEAD/DEAH box helicase family protein, partial [Pseudobutyrivibrio sp.]|nr:DEAD/DEAH box helicase family protein [Pseudobutyrivibrio sp.]